MTSPPSSVLSTISRQSSGFTRTYITPSGSICTSGPISQKPWQPLILMCRLFSASPWWVRQSPLGTLLPQVLIHLHGPAGDTARTGTDQHVQGRSAPFQRLRRLFVHGAEALPCQLAHSAASFPRMASNSASAVSGVILAYTSPSTVITGARPQAPRQATVSSVNTPSALVLRLPSSFRYS